MTRGEDMEDIQLKNGILCGLLSTGLGIGGASGGSSETEEGKLPSVEVLKVVNIAGYNEAETYLKVKEYMTILSSSQSYMPNQGYVMIGGFDMLDAEDWNETPKADIRITVDGTVVYEGDSYEFFENMSFDPPKVFQYHSSFDIAAKRKNCTENMFIRLRETMVVGIN